jgi:flagellar basal body-associated protein FliL
MVSNKVILIVLVITVLLLGASLMISNFSEEQGIKPNFKGVNWNGNVNLVINPQSPLNTSENG